MPTILRTAGYRFFFFSREENEPPHIHVEQAERYAKLWLEPVTVAHAKGFRSGELSEIIKVVLEHRVFFVERWHEHFDFEPLAMDVSVSAHAIHVVLADGREIVAPLAWFPRLQKGSEEQRGNWRLIGGGIGIHWPDLDEDISVQSLLSMQ